MGKIPTIAIVAIALVLVIGISVACFYFLIKPQQKILTDLRGQLEAEKQVAQGKTAAEAELDATKLAWKRAQDQLAQVCERKSIKISMYMPILAMTAMWREYRDDLPRAVEQWVQAQGCTIESGAAMPAPSLSPPTVPANGFLQVPEGQVLNLSISGTMANLEKLYRSLNTLPRVATIGGLSLSGRGDRLTASVPLSMWIIVEGAEAVAPPPAAAMPGGGGPGGMPGGPGGAPGAGPPGGPGGPGGAPPGGPGGGEEEGKKGGKKGDDEGDSPKPGKKADSGGDE